MSIIVVGNGPSVLQHEAGAEIDAFDEVVRFNNFELEGYEKYVGTKTTIWARPASAFVKERKAKHFKRIIAFATYGIYLPVLLEYIPTLRRLYKRIEIVGENACREIGDQVGLDQPNPLELVRLVAAMQRGQRIRRTEWCSAGILAIAYLLREYDHLTIHGFDHINIHPNAHGHYYPKKPMGDKGHNGSKERAFVEKYIKEGRIQRLR